MATINYKSAQSKTIDITIKSFYDLDYDRFKAMYSGDMDVEKVWYYLVQANGKEGIEFETSDEADEDFVEEALGYAIDDAEDEVKENEPEDEEEAEDEVLNFEGVNGYKRSMTVAEWRSFPEYRGKDAKKATCVGSKGSQFEYCYKP